MMNMRFTQYLKTEKEINPDIKDKKILYWLSENSRNTYTQIAKKVGLSKDSIKYRIKNLEKKGIIQGYLSVIDVSKFGYNTYHLFLQLNQINKEIRAKLIETLKLYSFVKAIIEFSGKYDFEISLVAGNIMELDEIITLLMEDISQYLSDYQILVISKNYVSRVFPGTFLELKEEEKIKEASDTKLKIDKVDLGILRLISENARRPLYDIANKTRISADSVKYRLKKLIKEKIILKFVPVINYSVLGYTVYGILMNIHNLDKKKEKTLESFLKYNSNVLWAVKTIGKYNLLMYVCVKKSGELHNTIIKMRDLFSSDIKEYETIIAYEEYKYTYFPESCFNLSISSSKT